LPVTLAVVSFVLSMLALFAGHNQGFMEEYAFVRVSWYIVSRLVWSTPCLTCSS
jgi:hypothetical protein